MIQALHPEDSHDAISKHRRLLCRSSTARAGVVAQLGEIPTDPTAVEHPRPVAEVELSNLPALSVEHSVHFFRASLSGEMRFT